MEWQQATCRWRQARSACEWIEVAAAAAAGAAAGGGALPACQQRTWGALSGGLHPPVLHSNAWLACAALQAWGPRQSNPGCEQATSQSSRALPQHEGSYHEMWEARRDAGERVLAAPLAPEPECMGTLWAQPFAL